MTKQTPSIENLKEEILKLSGELPEPSTYNGKNNVIKKDLIESLEELKTRKNLAKTILKKPFNLNNLLCHTDGCIITHTLFFKFSSIL